MADATIDSFAPVPEAAWFERMTHQRDGVLLAQAKLVANRFKRRAVFPGHLDDAIPVLCAQILAIDFFRYHVLVRRNGS